MHIKKDYFVVLLFSIAAILIFAKYFIIPATQTVPQSFTIGNRTYNFSAVAVTTAELEKGLMNATVTNKTFMLFIFQNRGIYPFWMYDTYSNLDIIWINGTAETGTVVYFVNATPCINKPSADCPLYIPEKSANYVIETKAGFDVKLGERIIFNST
jgi:uncharacterized membrane protein (UPF0127 family)